MLEYLSVLILVVVWTYVGWAARGRKMERDGETWPRDYNHEGHDLDESSAPTSFYGNVRYRHNGNKNLYEAMAAVKVRVQVGNGRSWVDGVLYRCGERKLYVRPLDSFRKSFDQVL